MCVRIGLVLHREKQPHVVKVLQVPNMSCVVALAVLSTPEVTVHLNAFQITFLWITSSFFEFREIKRAALRINRAIQPNFYNSPKR